MISDVFGGTDLKRAAIFLALTTVIAIGLGGLFIVTVRRMTPFRRDERRDRLDTGPFTLSERRIDITGSRVGG